MIKAFLFVFEPVKTWDKVARTTHSVGGLVTRNLLPMLLITAVVEGYGLVNWGKHPAMSYQGLRKFPVGQVAVYEALLLVLLSGVLLVVAQVLRALGETFHSRHTFAQALTVVVHGLSPLFVLRLLDAFPLVNPWVSWSIGILLSMAILYQGLPRIMMPDPPHALGLYLTSCLVVLLATGLVRFLTAWYLAGRFPAVESWISGLAARLPF